MKRSGAAAEVVRTVAFIFSALVSQSVSQPAGRRHSSSIAVKAALLVEVTWPDNWMCVVHSFCNVLAHFFQEPALLFCCLAGLCCNVRNGCMAGYKEKREGERTREGEKALGLLCLPGPAFSASASLFVPYRSHGGGCCRLLGARMRTINILHPVRRLSSHRHAHAHTFLTAATSTILPTTSSNKNRKPWFKSELAT